MGLNVSAQLEDSAYIFDAVWAAALALNNTNSNLSSFMYNGPADGNTSRYIYEELINSNFFGLTVSVVV